LFNFESLSLSFAYSGYLLVLALLIIAGYSWYVYRYTLPVVSPAKRIMLASLRALALILLVFIIFEPIVTIAKKNILEPEVLVFADNSRSMTFNDGTGRSDAEKKILGSYINNGISGNSEFFSFGSKVSRFNPDSTGRLKFNEGSTDFTKIFSSLVNRNDEGKTRNISSIVIISDGVITEGSTPLFTAEKLNIPVYTIGIGDSARRNDIEVRNVLFNEFIYAETPTTINAAVSGKGYEGKTIQVSLYENNTLAGQSNISITGDEIQNVNFNYTPKTGGEKKLSVVVADQPGEYSKLNNKKTFFVNVLSNKIKALIIAGAPSTDLTFIRNSLKEDPNLTINSITQVAAGKFLENNNRTRLIDSSDILYLVGFPSKETPPDLLQKVKKEISASNKPFFIILSDGTDLNKLKELQADLPFSIGNISQGYSEVQPDISADKYQNPLLQNNNSNPVAAWNNLPPVLLQNSVFEAKPESEVLSRIKINNIPLNRPLVVSRRLGSKKSVAVLAKDIWRWKLQTSTKNLNLFDNFILQGVKWLNTSDELKRVSIKTSKKIYSPGEDIEFTGQVYDVSFNPVNDAEVKVNITSGSDKYEITLNPIGSGLYEGTLPAAKSGDYFFSGYAQLNGNKLGTDNGRFNVGEVDIEMINPRMDAEFLSLLAARTGGKFFTVKNYNQLFDILKQVNERASKENITTSETDLWSNEWLMAVVIFLFAAEWFIRKRSGML
jgi:hypothetical protein